jgi:hypothetical protein
MQAGVWGANCGRVAEALNEPVEHIQGVLVKTGHHTGATIQL